MDYIPVLILLAIATVLGSVILVASYFLGPRMPTRRKNMAFECGVPGTPDVHQRFSVRFYLVAILFLLFDVEAVFFFPWAVVYRKFLAINSFMLGSMGVFVGVLLVGYYFVLKRGALEWE